MCSVDSRNSVILNPHDTDLPLSHWADQLNDPDPARRQEAQEQKWAVALQLLERVGLGSSKDRVAALEALAGCDPRAVHDLCGLSAIEDARLRSKDPAVVLAALRALRALDPD